MLPKVMGETIEKQNISFTNGGLDLIYTDKPASLCLHNSPEETPANTIPLFFFWLGTSPGIIFNYLLLKREEKKRLLFFRDRREEEQNRRRNVLVYEIVGISKAGFVSGFTDVSALCPQTK